MRNTVDEHLVLGILLKQIAIGLREFRCALADGGFQPVIESPDFLLNSFAIGNILERNADRTIGKRKSKHRPPSFLDLFVPVDNLAEITSLFHLRDFPKSFDKRVRNRGENLLHVLADCRLKLDAKQSRGGSVGGPESEHWRVLVELIDDDSDRDVANDFGEQVNRRLRTLPRGQVQDAGATRYVTTVGVKHGN